MNRVPMNVTEGRVVVILVVTIAIIGAVLLYVTAPKHLAADPAGRRSVVIDGQAYICAPTAVLPE